MVRIGRMAIAIFSPNRRETMVGLCAAALGPTLPSLAAAQRRVDRLRYDGLTRSLVDHGVARAIAEVCADITLNALIGAQMDVVYFPVTMREFGARVRFHDLAEETVQWGRLEVRTEGAQIGEEA